MILDALNCLLGVAPTDTSNECLQHQDCVVLLPKKVNLAILEELLSET
jgi:hypothetical protein